MTTFSHRFLLVSAFFWFLFTHAEQVRSPLLHLNHTEILLQEKIEAMTALKAVKLDDDPHQPPPPYMFALYHREMFAENQSESSLQEARIARDISRARYIASVFGSNNSKLEHQVPTTSTVYYTGDGEYVVSFWVGSERERSLLLLDTGFPLVWWQCGPCDPGKCYQQKVNPIYDSASSTTFRQVDCTLEASSCLLPGNVVTCSAQSHRCDYQAQFGSNQVTKGFMARETITFIIGQGSATIEFGCGKDQTSGSQFDGEFDGILGIGGGLFREGLGRYSLPSQLGTNLFSFCLPSPSSKVPSLVYFGTAPFIDGRYGTVNALMVRDDNLQSFYFLQLKSVDIDGRYTVEIESPGELGQQVFVDTGSSWTHLPGNVYMALRYEIRQMFWDKPYANPAPGQYQLCYESDDVKVSDFPTVGLIFRSGSGDSLPLKIKNVAVAYQGYSCLTLLPSDGPYAYIGGNHLHGHQVTIDIAAMTMSLTPGVCD